MSVLYLSADVWAMVLPYLDGKDAYRLAPLYLTDDDIFWKNYSLNTLGKHVCSIKTAELSRKILHELVRFIRGWDDDCYERLLERKHLFAKCINRCTPLMSAIAYSSEEKIKQLIALGADVNMIREDNGMTALMYAVQCSETKLIEFLINSGANVDAQDYDGRTALMYAARSSRKAIVQLLIKLGADVNATDNQGRTALMFAKRKVAIELLKNGADIGIRDRFGSNVFDFIKSRRRKTHVRVLHEAIVHEYYSTKIKNKKNLKL
jgi:ankyrin repeat protein